MNYSVWKMDVNRALRHDIGLVVGGSRVPLTRPASPNAKLTRLKVGYIA